MTTLGYDHEAIRRQRDKVENVRDVLQTVAEERDNLRAQNAELLAALQIMVYRMDHNMGEPTEHEQAQIRAAIAKATGAKS